MAEVQSNQITPVHAAALHLAVVRGGEVVLQHWVQAQFLECGELVAVSKWQVEWSVLVVVIRLPGKIVDL